MYKKINTSKLKRQNNKVELGTLQNTISHQTRDVSCSLLHSEWDYHDRADDSRKLLDFVLFLYQKLILDIILL